MDIMKREDGMLEALFDVSEIANMLNVAPGTVRYWMERGWLKPNTVKGKAYMVSWTNLQAFLDAYKARLRKISQTSLSEIAPELTPEMLTAEAEYLALKKEVCRLYSNWVFEACQKQAKLGLPAEQLLKAKDEEIAEAFNIPLPEGYSKIAELEPEVLSEIKAEEVARYRRITVRV